MNSKWRGKVINEMTSTKVARTLTELPESLHNFSSALALVERVDIFDQNAHSSHQLNDLRKKIRSNIRKYGTDTLPACNEFVENLKIFYGTYSKMSFDDWRTQFTTISRKAEKLEEICKDIYRQHVGLSGSFKSDEVKAKRIQCELERVSIKQRNEKSHLKKSASSKKLLAIGMGLTVIGLPFAMKVAQKGKIDEIKANAKGVQLELNEHALDVLKMKLIPALQSIIKCLIQSAECLSELVRLVRKMQSVECTSKDRDDSDESDVSNDEDDIYDSECSDDTDYDVDSDDCDYWYYGEFWDDSDDIYDCSDSNEGDCNDDSDDSDKSYDRYDNDDGDSNNDSNDSDGVKDYQHREDRHDSDHSNYGDDKSCSEDTEDSDDLAAYNYRHDSDNSDDNNDSEDIEDNEDDDGYVNDTDDEDNSDDCDDCDDFEGLYDKSDNDYKQERYGSDDDEDANYSDDEYNSNDRDDDEDLYNRSDNDHKQESDSSDEDEDELRADYTTMMTCFEDMNLTVEQLSSAPPYAQSDLLALTD